MLLVHGGSDQQSPSEHAQKMSAAAGTQKKELKVFTRAGGGYLHCQVDNISIGSAHMWDWADDALVARR